MRQALGNLVQNAVEAMPGGGRLTVSAGLRPPLGRRREVEVRVSDTGAGIPQDRLGKNFLPFFSTKTKRAGLGLPLGPQNVPPPKSPVGVGGQERQGGAFLV